MSLQEPSESFPVEPSSEKSVNEQPEENSSVRFSTDTYGGGTLVAPNPGANGRCGSFELPITEIESAELDDGSLLDLCEDPENPNSTLLVRYKDNEISYHANLEHAGRRLIPVPRAGVLKYIRLPREAKPSESNVRLLLDIAELILKCVNIDSERAAVLALFVLCTWLIDRLPIAPYVCIVGLPQSGKTTLLQVLNLVCRRPLLTADVTPRIVYEGCSSLKATLLIDEAGSSTDPRRLRRILRMGTTRDVLAVKGNRIFNAFGAKVICWQEPPDDAALNSRCIEISMIEANNRDLVKPSHPTIGHLALKLQSQLLHFRLANYKEIQIPNLQWSDSVPPRVRDLVACLAAPVGKDHGTVGRLVNYFTVQAWLIKEPLPFPQDVVLAALFFHIHERDAAELIFVGDLTGEVNRLLEKSGSRFHLKPRRVGHILSVLGFSERRRTREGWGVSLILSDQERLHKLVKNHGIDVPPNLRAFTGGCRLCQ